MTNQDFSQKTLLLIVIAGFILIVAVWWFNMRREGYNPYSNTNGIPQGYTNFGYLDQYSNKDWYQFNPWIYPSFDYGRLLFNYERKNNKYLEKKRKIMLDNLENIPQ